MKRVVPGICLGIGLIAGYAMNPRAGTGAQAPAPRDQTAIQIAEAAAIKAAATQSPEERVSTIADLVHNGLAQGRATSRAQDGKAYVIAVADLKQKFPPADAAGNLTPPNSSPPTDLGWDPVYSLTLVRWPYRNPPVKSANTGNMVHWADAEMHEQKTQLYIIISGAGQVMLGGKPPKERLPSINGQHHGEPLGVAQGATAHRLNAGDIVVVPPYAWHQPQSDPGQTLTYLKVDMLTPRLLP